MTIESARPVRGLPPLHAQPVSMQSFTHSLVYELKLELVQARGR